MTSSPRLRILINLRSLAPLGAALIWGVNIPVMKGAIGDLHPFAFNTIRLTLSVLLLGLMDWHSRRGKPAPPTPWRGVILVGLLSGLLYQLLFLGGMGHTSAGHTAVFIGTGPFWTAIIGRIVGMERPLPWAWVGLGLAFGGTVLVVTDSAGGATLTGDLLVLFAAMAWAAGTILSKRVLEQLEPLRLAYLYALVVLPLHWMIAWPLFTMGELSAAPAGFWGCVLYSGVLSTGIAYALWNIGLVAVGPARTAVYVNLVPVIATIIAWSVLGEAVGPTQVAGGVTVIGGLLLVQKSRRA
ncbi:MAG: drug/metabolite transporter (DMT)-like permease [Planctomycetota bacterium]|jgi:drug/metabolite transporter (DMT)-like permease